MKTLIRLGIRPQQADLESSLGTHANSLVFVTTQLKLWQSYFWKWRSGKILCLRLLGYKFQISQKAWSTVTVKNVEMTENVVVVFFVCFVLFVCFFVVFFLFFFSSFMCHVCVLSFICLFIISGGFDALHQLSVKRDPMEIQHPKFENSRCCPLMRDNGRCDILQAA